MQYKRYINNVLMNVGGMYLYDIKTGDAPGVAYKSVPKEVQRASVDFLLKELYDMDWLNNEELLRNLPPQKNQALEMQIGTASIFKNLLTIKKKNAVILSAAQSEDPYTLEDYLNDIYRTVWAKTIAGKSLEPIDKTYQTDFIVSMISAFDPTAKAGSILFTDPNATRSEYAGPWNQAYAPTLDEVLLYGLDCEGFVSRMEDPLGKAVVWSENNATFETEGFGWQREVKSNEIYNTKALQYRYLQKVKALLEKRQSSGSADTQEHYKYLLYKVTKILEAR